MPSTISTINNKVSIDQLSTIQFVKHKKGKHSKKVMIHQSGSPLPPDDFVLFPQDVVKNHHSSVRDAKPRRPIASKSAKESSSLVPQHHVIEPKAPRLTGPDVYRPSERAVCLEHMSTVNCTAECANANPLAHLKMPPKAPSPRRLPTPDLSDLEEDDLWTCCGSSWSSLAEERTRCNRKADSEWDEMGEKLAKAKAWQSRRNTNSRK